MTKHQAGRVQVDAIREGYQAVAARRLTFGSRATWYVEGFTPAKEYTAFWTFKQWLERKPLTQAVQE